MTAVEWNEHQAQLANQVKAYVESGDRAHVVPVLAEMLSEQYEPDNLFAQATIRYLVHRKLWTLSEEPFSPVMLKFFGPREATTRLSPQQYVSQTDALIKAWYDYDMPTKPAAPVKAVKAVEKKKPAKKRARKKAAPSTAKSDDKPENETA